MTGILVNTLIVFGAVVATEIFAIVIHKYIMHGPGWGWHQSHHEPRTGFFEKNDLYAVIFSLLAMALFIIGSAYFEPVYYAAIGMTLYGILYFFVHDGLVHRRLPLRVTPRHGYLKRLTQAHKLHHATFTKDGCVSFGFLWAEDVATLKKRLLRNNHSGR